jgi:hypothetical protein
MRHTEVQGLRFPALIVGKPHAGIMGQRGVMDERPTHGDKRPTADGRLQVRGAWPEITQVFGGWSSTSLHRSTRARPAISHVTRAHPDHRSSPHRSPWSNMRARGGDSGGSDSRGHDQREPRRERACRLGTHKGTHKRT